MAITQKSDYTGFHKVFKSNKDALEEYIDRYEPIYLKKLLGCELYELFAADLTNDTPQTPQTQRFIDLFDAFCEDDSYIGRGLRVKGYDDFNDDDCYCSNYKQYESQGIADMLKGFVRFHFLRDQSTDFAETGMSMHNSDTFRTLTGHGFNSRMSKIFNDSARSFRAIQYRICDRIASYPEYEGVKVGTVSILGY